MIDKTAQIDPTAQIDSGVHIGPWTWIGPFVEIGAGSWIGPHVVINGPTKIGRENKIYQFASIGEASQDKKYKGETTRLEIGDRNTFRECCTVHRGTFQGGGVTRIGHDNLFMAYTHVAHDCMIGDEVIFSNNASVAGHVTVGNYASLGGFAGVHQFCSVGAYSFIAAGSIVFKDIPPFIMASGYPAGACGLNAVGLERRGFSPETLAALKRAYKIVFRQSFTSEEAIEALEVLIKETPEVQLLIDFLAHSSRGIVR